MYRSAAVKAGDAHFPAAASGHTVETGAVVGQLVRSRLVIECGLMEVCRVFLQSDCGFRAQFLLSARQCHIQKDQEQ